MLIVLDGLYLLLQVSFIYAYFRLLNHITTLADDLEYSILMYLWNSWL